MSPMIESEVLMKDEKIEGVGLGDQATNLQSLTIYSVPPRVFSSEPCPNLASFSDSRSIMREELAKLFDVLINIRNLTDPARGLASTFHKHERAQNAIIFANHLALGLAGWAYNHMAGCAMEPEMAVDRHVHEENGKRIAAADFAGNRKCDRSVLANLVENVQEFLPDDLGRQLVNGLRALEFGEVFPLLGPKKPKLPGRGYTDWNLRLTAVCHWHHLQALGEKSEIALEKVAEAFGETTAAVKMWDYRISEVFDAATVNLSIEIAKHAAMLKLRPESEMSEVDRSALELYKDGDLQGYGDLYKRRGERNGSTD
jgi:hypothetical protein